MPAPPADLDATITRVLREQPGVRFAVLYGSRAEERATPVSDLDVAAYVDDAGDFLAAAAALDETFPEMRVDLVDLSAQPSLVYYEILASGRVLFAHDEDFFQKEKLRVMREYLDFRPTYERVLDAMDQRLETGTYGKPA
jgi:predicted nucleotidyltransferase